MLLQVPSSESTFLAKTPIDLAYVSTHVHKVLGFVLIFLVLQVQGMEPLKERVVQAKVNVSLVADGTGQHT